MSRVIQAAAVAAAAIACTWSAGGVAAVPPALHGADADVAGLAVPAGHRFKQIVAGWSHTCGVSSTGGALCWGDNTYGGVGDGTLVDRKLPVPVTGLGSGVKSIAVGGSFSCALTTAGGVKCWGFNGGGDLGNGTTVNSPTPVNVVGLASGVTAIRLGHSHACALTSAGAVKCWGDNYYGQLGDGTSTSRSTPVTVSGLSTGATAVTTGSYHSCVLVGGGAAKCWGENSTGELGDGTETDQHMPVAVVGLTGASAIAAGGGHTCVRTTAGAAKCWGWNELGQLGDGTTIDRPHPVTVTGLATGVAGITTGSWSTCARLTSGALKCWGNNRAAQLGDGTTTNRLVPTQVSGLTSGVTSPSAGANHACAIVPTGIGKCWGSGLDGRLGNGGLAKQLVPTTVR